MYNSGVMGQFWARARNFWLFFDDWPFAVGIKIKWFNFFENHLAYIIECMNGTFQTLIITLIRWKSTCFMLNKKVKYLYQSIDFDWSEFQEWDPQWMKVQSNDFRYKLLEKKNAFMAPSIEFLTQFDHLPAPLSRFTFALGFCIHVMQHLSE